MIVKAITVRQPWAWATAMGHKPIENRSWTTSYRGPLAIHAASRWDDAGAASLQAIVRIMRQLRLPFPRTLAEDKPYSELGKVIAVGELTGICTAGQRGEPCGCGPWAQDGQAHWAVADVRRLAEPFPARGRLQLWDVDLADRAFA